MPKDNCDSRIHLMLVAHADSLGFLFNNFMLLPHNIRNQISIKTKRWPPMLLVFDQQGHPFGKEFIHWLTDEEKDSAHVHGSINCAKVKSYLE